jgi:hypothetical protein
MALALAPARAADAQAATEIYIPIGRSPGLSRVHTVIGTIERVDEGSGEGHTMVVVSQGRSWTLRMTSSTRVFIDRSALRRPNGYGGHEDCRAGALVEVKPQAVGGNQVAACEWIKVRAEPQRPAQPPPARRR